MPKQKPAPKKTAKKRDVFQDISDAAKLGGNAMASSEPFGPVIGAAMGAVEEGMAMLTKKKPAKKPRKK